MSAPVYGLVPLARVQAHTSNVRRDLGDLRSLTASIRQYGVLNPVVVERRGDMLRLRDGHRRRAAAEIAGLHRIPALVHAAALEDDVAWLREAVQHNEQRAAMRSTDRKHAIERMLAAGMSRAEVAIEFGVTRDTLSKWLAEGTRVEQGKRKYVPTTVGVRVLRENLTEVRAAVEAGDLDVWGVLNRLEALLPQTAEVTR